MSEETKLPTIRANRGDIDLIFGLFAALQEIEKATDQFAARLAVIPNGERDIRMISSVLDNLTTNLIKTMPPEKMLSVKRMDPHMGYKLTCGIQASQLERGESIVRLDDLQALTKFAYEQCKFCVDGKCNRCELGKAFDHVLTIDRDGESWAYIDFEEAAAK